MHDVSGYSAFLFPIPFLANLPFRVFEAKLLLDFLCSVMYCYTHGMYVRMYIEAWMVFGVYLEIWIDGDVAWCVYRGGGSIDTAMVL